MPDAPTYALFVAAALALLLVPGPAVIYVVARSVSGGRLTGLVSVLGVELGTLLHAVFAAAGLSAIVASSAAAFSVVKWLGAAYLVYLGLRQIFGRGDGQEEAPSPEGNESRFRVFYQSVLVQVLNPKVALFFLAFFPQFVHADRGAAWSQILILGAIFCLVGLASDSLYAVGSSTVRERLLASPRLVAWSNRASGTMCLGLGAWSIWSGARAQAN